MSYILTIRQLYCIVRSIKLVLEDGRLQALDLSDKTDTMLSPVRQESLTGMVENRLHAYLKKSQFLPGDRLPGEKELSEMLEVSRPVVREALSRLRMIGLVDSRKRRGMVVGKPAIFETMEKVIDPDFLEQEEQEDFFKLRLTIELGMADLLVINITPQEIEELDLIVAREEADPGNYRLFLDCDYAFHSALYRATRCRSLASFQSILLKFFGDYETRRRNSPGTFAQRFSDPDLCTHRDIVEAVKTLDPETIQRTMRRHFSYHLNRIRTNQPVA